MWLQYRYQDIVYHFISMQIWNNKQLFMQKQTSMAYMGEVFVKFWTISMSSIEQYSNDLLIISDITNNTIWFRNFV
jgi:hypothetical protein